MPTPTGPVNPIPPPQSQPPKGPPAPMPLSTPSQKDAFYLSSPFAKMFARTGAMPTGAEIHQIINGILQQEIGLIQKQDAKAKETLRKLKRQMEGEDDS